MNEQTQLLIKDAEYLTCPEAELIPDGVRLTALINLVRKLAEAVPTAYTAGLERAREISNNVNGDEDIIGRYAFESAIQEEINKSKV